jgi:hypothetical protein
MLGSLQAGLMVILNTIYKHGIVLQDFNGEGGRWKSNKITQQRFSVYQNK